MNVAELARELGVPPSSIIEQCQRFGIDASWAGADLGGADVVVLRAELANEDGLLDLTGHGEHGEADGGPDTVAVPSVPVPEPEPPAAEAAPVDLAKPAEVEPPAAPAALPPTAVGSMPGLADDLASEAARTAPVEPADGLRTAGPGFSTAAAPAQGSSAPKAGERIGTSPPTTRHLDRGVRAGGAALLAGLVFLVGTELLANEWVTPFAWLVAVGFFAVAVLDGNRARHHGFLHPERVAGGWLGLAIALVGLVGLVGVGAMVWTVTRSAPAADAPLSLGKLDAVTTGRWGYQRFRLLADHGWKSPAKPAGTCWRNDDEEGVRDDARVELGNEKVACAKSHTFEVIAVAPMAPGDADAPYPGADELMAFGADGPCKEALDDLGGLAKDEPVPSLFVEHPTGPGWAAGDHDVACVALTEPRTGSVS